MCYAQLIHILSKPVDKLFCCAARLFYQERINLQVLKLSASYYTEKIILVNKKD